MKIVADGIGSFLSVTLRRWEILFGVFSRSLFYVAVKDIGKILLPFPSQLFKGSKILSESQNLESVRYSTMSHLYSRVRTRPCTLQTKEHRIGATSQQHRGLGG